MGTSVSPCIQGANILVEKSGRIKLADFGMAKTLVEQLSVTRSFKGSAYWMAGGAHTPSLTVCSHKQLPLAESPSLVSHWSPLQLNLTDCA
jgi:serine/threonine protein kinase